MSKNKKIVILGGGTNTYISNHFAISAPAYGATAKTLYRKFLNHPENKMDTGMYLTKMADPSQTTLDTPEDIEKLVDTLVADPDVRVIIFNVAMVDFKPVSLDEWRRDDHSLGETRTKFGKYEERLSTRGTPALTLEMEPYHKIIQKIRKERKDILLVGFKTTCGATKEEQYEKGLRLCKEASANIVFVNDVDETRIKALDVLAQQIHEHYNKPNQDQAFVHTNGRTIEYALGADINNLSYIRSHLGELAPELQNNGLVTPEESSYWYNTRDEALDALVQMVLDRSHLHFTRSTVVDSETVPWNVPTLKIAPKQYVKIKEGMDTSQGEVIMMPNQLIPETFRTVFNWVRSQGAYKHGPTGATVGHMGIKLGPHEFLTTKRKTDFNKMEEVGLVRVITDDPDDIFGYKHFFMSPEKKEFEYWKDCLKNPNFTMMAMPPLQVNPDPKKVLEENLAIHNASYKDLMDKDYPGWEKDFIPRNDLVIAFGAKPSVGGQSQRSLFEAFPHLNCIIHFHCPLKEESRKEFNTTPQFSFECGSHECIQSNITGFKSYRVSDEHFIWAGHMDYHGPNIVFSSDIDPQLVIDFIKQHWDLSRKTDGLSIKNR